MIFCRETSSLPEMDLPLKKISINMSYELTGKLLIKFDTTQRTESFKTREFVVEKSEDVNGKLITNYIKVQYARHPDY